MNGSDAGWDELRRIVDANQYYRATAHEQWLLGPRDQRIKVLDVS